jgi:hypothetical protein
LTDTAYSAHPVVTIAADAVLPAIAALAILLPAMAWKRGRLAAPGLFYICAFGSVALMYAIRFADHRMKIWAAHELKFSSHTALGISLLVTLTAFRVSLLPVFAIVLAMYLWVITYLGYHNPGDIFSTAAVILPASLLCHLPWWMKRPRQK